MAQAVEKQKQEVQTIFKAKGTKGQGERARQGDGAVQAGVSGDKGQRKVSGDRGKQVHWAPEVWGGSSDRGQNPVRETSVKEWFGASRRVVTGFKWDPKRREILREDGSATNPVTAKERAEMAEEQNDREAVQMALDLFAGTQSMGPVYLTSEEGGGLGVRPARRKGAGILSSSEEVGEKYSIRHAAGECAKDSW